MIENDDFHDVLIIGAGPSGLMSGQALARRGLAVTVLERDQIGSTWRRIPEDLRVLSPWWTNVLDVKHVFTCNPLSRVAAWRFRDYLIDFAARAKLDVREGVDVDSIRRISGGWAVVDTDDVQWYARQVVCATGYFATPLYPKPSIVRDDTVRTVHAADISDYNEFARTIPGKRILLVGKRVTAGQLLLELWSRGFQILLSSRSPIEFRRSGLLGQAYEQLYFFYEVARIRLQPRLNANSYPAMDGGKTERLITAGEVRAVPRPRAVRRGRVELEDGTAVNVDMVIFATGYRPSLSYLKDICRLDPLTGLPLVNGFGVRGADGVYVVGFDNLRNFRSRYLRGIRNDARLLARIIAGDRRASSIS